MTTAELLRTARERGIELRPDGACLCYSAPPGALDDDLRAKLTRHKGEILRALTRRETHPCDRCGRFAFPSSRVCYWCRNVPEAEA